MHCAKVAVIHTIQCSVGNVTPQEDEDDKGDEEEDFLYRHKGTLLLANTQAHSSRP